jgi:hypothetical protein
MKGDIKLDLGEYKIEVIHDDNGYLMITVLDELGEPIDIMEITNDDGQENNNQVH